MNKQTLFSLCLSMGTFAFTLNTQANSDQLLHTLTQETQLQAPMMVAVGVVDRVDRRMDHRDNTMDRVDDKQEFREERRDCTGDGADCRSDNRQDKRHDTMDRTEERVDDRRDRRGF